VYCQKCNLSVDYNDIQQFRSLATEKAADSSMRFFHYPCMLCRSRRSRSCVQGPTLPQFCIRCLWLAAVAHVLPVQPLPIKEVTVESLASAFAELRYLNFKSDICLHAVFMSSCWAQYLR
jgi:hypothetical protein